VRLTDHEDQDNNPSWSPDGSAIAFETHRAPPPEIFIVNADGSGLRRLTPEGLYTLQPAWSPDGTRIAFAAYIKSNENLYVINADGTGMRPLTASPRSVSPESPDWSPDGRYLAFHAFGHGNMDLFILDVAVAMSAILGESWGTLKREVGGCCE
jgi:TolB protein